MIHGRVPELDGLRGIAILLVFVGHLLEGVFPHDRPLFAGSDFRLHGGFTGVQLFFVLSGFLITTVLVDERHRTGATSFRGFYLRRIRRLVPALVLACACYALYALVALPADARPAAFASIARALTYTSNLQPLEPHGWPDSLWLNHTWSLAVEEQFYLTWPVLLVVLASRGRRVLAGVAIALALATLLLRVAADAMIDAHEVMYLLLRWDAMLVGCALALIRVPAPRGIGWLGAAVLAWYTLAPPARYGPLDYTITAVACGAALLGALGTAWLRNPVLRFFGLISYGLYIWHLLLMRLDVPTWAAGGASVVVAYASYRFVEARFLRSPSRVFPAPAAA